MHDINKLLEQDEVARGCPDTCANQDAGKMPPLELSGDDLLRGLTKICQTIMSLIAKRFHSVYGGIQSLQYLCSRHAWEGVKLG